MNSINFPGAVAASGFSERRSRMSTQNVVDVVNQGNGVETAAGKPQARVLRPPKPPEKVRMEKLKAERIQELLKALPGWKLGHRGRAIVRQRELDTPQGAASFAAFVAGLAAEAGQTVNLHVDGGLVVVTLPGRAAGAPFAEVTLETLGFAQQIG